MCGRFALDDKINSWITEWVQEGNDFRDWTVAKWVEWKGAYNVKPTQQAPALFVHRGELRFEPARWSLVPPWAKELKSKYPTFNARSEGITGKATWRGPIKSRRAIIPATGYYEWQTVGKAKTPYFIHDRDAPYIGMAGMYSWWHQPDADEDEGWHLTSTILTSDAIRTLEDLHDREPVILPPEMWEWWIDPAIAADQDTVDQAVSAGLAQAENLAYHQVAPLNGDGPGLIEAV